tara:strand:+ start:120 stop:941 length:822 start_codon:yes stop_codon:yes gene_type:complete
LPRTDVDASEFLSKSPPPADAPRIAVVVSLWFPGMNIDSRDLMAMLTSIAFDAVQQAGGYPVLVDSSVPTPELTEKIVDECDGILFLGGGDVDASLYGVDGPVANSYGADRDSDEFCIGLIRRSLAVDKTVLSICRGSQLLNVACGGSLVPDIVPSSLHKGARGKPLFVDEVITLREGTKIREILGRARVAVRSAHHQAVDAIGAGLVASAVAEDGIVEGTEHTGRRWVVGIQWHPEERGADALDRRLIFEAFVSECARVAGEAASSTKALYS